MAKKIYEKIIVGGGASGLMAAYSACCVKSNANEKPEILVLEANDKPGKKLTATGNGKCNYTNLNQSIDCYRSGDSEKAFRIIGYFDQEETLKLFKGIGILNVERNGYCYPHGEQAKTLRDVLVKKAESIGATILTGKKVSDIEKQEGIYTVTCEDGSSYQTKKLVICAGGKAAPVFGTDGTILEILKKMGFGISEPKPALCGLTLNHEHLRKIDGVRLKCKVSLLTDSSWGEPYSERGEIIFNKNGINGIPVMNLSRYAINALEKNEHPVLQFDFFPDMDIKDLKCYMNSVTLNSVVPLGTALSALINDKFLEMLMSEAGLPFDQPSDTVDSRTIRKGLGTLAGSLKNYKIEIKGDTGFQNAQTTQGGVKLKEVDERTLESYKYPGMFLAGEVLDVDGMCGGYNLQWAWTTGYLAGKN